MQPTQEDTISCGLLLEPLKKRLQIFSSGCRR